MAEAIVSTVLQQLVSVVSREREQLVVGVRQEFDWLISYLRQIERRVAGAERWQFETVHVKQLIDEIRAVCYDIDDVLDEWNTAILKSQIEAGYECQAAPMTRRKVSSFVSCCFSYGEVSMHHDVSRKIQKIDTSYLSMEIARHDFSRKIQEFLKRSSYLGEKVAKFSSLWSLNPVELPTTTSVVDASGVKGREDEKNDIKRLLLKESSKPSSDAPHIISLVGMGGIGKTTLAQQLFNDNEVEAHFEERIWVCVSHSFGVKRIAKVILASLINRTPDLAESLTILQRLQENLVGKKFLLVLDDVWEEDPTKWEHLKYSLVCASPRSKILVTTQKESVAKMMGSSHVHKLRMLSTEECWSIFREDAFFGRSRKECERLEGIGRKIVDMCKGLPLVAKVLGGLLRSKTFQEWQLALNYEIGEIEEVQRALRASLLLGYNNMLAPLRQCFSICASFPKDYTIQTRRLILLWIAQGYLEKDTGKSMNEVGEQSFQYLVERSFFQDFIIDKTDGSILSCKLHDMMHDLAQFLTNDECISIDINNLEESTMHRMYNFSENVRHLTVVFQKLATFPDSLYHLKKLRTLLIESKGNLVIEAALPELFNQLTCLRSLNLRGCGIEKIPSNINKLVHLRQLDLSFNRNLKELPETFCELYALLILDVSYCDKLALPRALDKLVNLSHLHNFDSNNPLPKRIGRLRCLETLDNFVVGKDGEAGNLEDLKNLNYLQGRYCTTGWFCISGLENVARANDLKRAQLEKKTQLSTLKLAFGGERAEWRKSQDQELIEALGIPSNLEGLWLFDYQASRIFPDWIMSLSNLTTLRLTNCINCEVLPPLGKLPSLQFLHLWGMPGVKEVGVEFLGIEIGRDAISSTAAAFPKLTKLYFINMGNWERWVDDIRTVGDGDSMETSIMPCLQHLCLSHCPKLRALPFYILQKTTLKKLDISRGCGVLEIRYDKGIGKDWLKISHIPSINVSHTIF